MVNHFLLDHIKSVSNTKNFTYNKYSLSHLGEREHLGSLGLIEINIERP